MPRIEDYALLSDLQSAALVHRSGSIDWACFPRFDSSACFAALLGMPEHGRWLIAPVGEVQSTERRYVDGTMILETTHRTETGTVRVIDFMPPRGRDPDIVRIVEGVEGSVELHSELVIRFDYGHIVPWVHRVDGVRVAVAGPDGLCLRTPVEMHGEELTTVSRFTVEAGQRLPFALTWYPSYEPLPQPIDPELAALETEAFWSEWSSSCRDFPRYGEAIKRSLIVLKALTHLPSGGIVAAPTTSLPERIGGVRNWDYRYCWLRDAALTLLSMINAGYRSEATAWLDWLLRAVAGDPADVQIMYGIAGERRLDERELPWLPGFEGSKPVRIGNAASKQLQLDVFGELLDAACQSLAAGNLPQPESWAIAQHFLTWLEDGWRREDSGLWEMRGPPRHFTHSKVMAWVAFDRAVRMHDEFGQPGPVERWRALRDEIKRDVLEQGWNAEIGSFAQSYGSREIDASLLLLPTVGFLPVDDPRMASTIALIERELTVDGLMRRYRTEGETNDSLPPGEGVFLPCSFWLVEVMALQGRYAEARTLFERLLSLSNDVGLLAEEYDPVDGRQLGNFPQAFTHLSLVSAALVLNGEPALRSPESTVSRKGSIDDTDTPRTPGSAQGAIPDRSRLREGDPAGNQQHAGG